VKTEAQAAHVVEMMADAAKLFAGHMGALAVLANVLIDKGIISREELVERLAQAHGAALQCAGGPEVALALAEMLRYLADDPLPPPRGRG
jgi:hypothetical protein